MELDRREVISNFADDLAQTLRIESQAVAHLKWKQRARRLFKLFVSKCGGEQNPGLIFLAGTPVRMDYIKKSMIELTKDKPFGKNFFYKSLPVNIEAWIRSICEFTIATHVPRWWSMRQSFKFRDVSKQMVFARIGICNEVREAEDALVCFSTCISRLGIMVQRVSRQTLHDVQEKRLACDRFTPVTHLKMENDTLNLGQGAEVVVERLVRVRPTQSLEYEEIIGLLVRGGSLVCVGTKKQLLHGFFLDAQKQVIKKWQDHLQYFLHDHLESVDACPIWRMQMCKTTFISEEDPLQGADCVVTITKGLQLETLLLLHRSSTVNETFDAYCKIADCAMNFMTQNNSLFEKKTCLLRENSDIAMRLSLMVKKRNWDISKNNGNEIPITRPHVEYWTGPSFNNVLENVPRKCRNAWELPDRTTVERNDTIVSRTLMQRERWPTDFRRCPLCPILHVDERKREIERCSSHFCKSKFIYADTFTHFCFRGNKRRRFEVDKCLPLFTDCSLRELEKHTDFEI